MLCFSFLWVLAVVIDANCWDVCTSIVMISSLLQHQVHLHPLWLLWAHKVWLTWINVVLHPGYTHQSIQQLTMNLLLLMFYVKLIFTCYLLYVTCKSDSTMWSLPTDNNYIMYILIAGLILLVVVLLVIMAVIGGYCNGWASICTYDFIS